MKIEDEVFARCQIDTKKLLDYGFRLENGKYSYTQNILDDSFRVELTWTRTRQMQGKIIDLAFNEEYVNFRMEEYTGKYVARVREVFLDILEDIRNQCGTSQYFNLAQSNRITQLIQEKFGHEPEFLFDKSEHTGIFRNSETKKWYAAILPINQNKLGKEDKEVEIINVKLDNDKAVTLIKEMGFYPGYHMNKKYWISIILDDTIEDERVMGYVTESYQLTRKRK